MKDTFFHFQSANSSLLLPVCRLDEQLKRHESCPENQTCTRRAYKMNREEQELETLCGLCRRWQHPWGPQFLSVVEVSRVIMTGFGVCQRVCHNMEILGKVLRAFNQAYGKLANCALCQLFIWQLGWNLNLTISCHCYENAWCACAHACVCACVVVVIFRGSTWEMLLRKMRLYLSWEINSETWLSLGVPSLPWSCLSRWVDVCTSRIPGDLPLLTGRFYFEFQTLAARQHLGRIPTTHRCGNYYSLKPLSLPKQLLPYFGWSFVPSRMEELRLWSHLPKFIVRFLNEHLDDKMIPSDKSYGHG